MYVYGHFMKIYWNLNELFCLNSNLNLKMFFSLFFLIWTKTLEFTFIHTISEFLLSSPSMFDVLCSMLNVQCSVCDCKPFSFLSSLRSLDSVVCNNICAWTALLLLFFLLLLLLLLLSIIHRWKYPSRVQFLLMPIPMCVFD